MIRALMETILGQAFSEALRFYIANSLPINLVVLVYGTVMLMSYHNLSRIRRRLIDTIVETLKPEVEAQRKIRMERVLKEIEIPWQTGVSGSQFPLIARQMALLPQRVSIETVQSLLPVEDLIEEAIIQLQSKV
jgi:hypothetical protein